MGETASVIQKKTAFKILEWMIKASQEAAYHDEGVQTEGDRASALEKSGVIESLRRRLTALEGLSAHRANELEAAEEKLRAARER